jgi:hypothetical protein
MKAFEPMKMGLHYFISFVLRSRKEPAELRLEGWVDGSAVPDMVEKKHPVMFILIYELLQSMVSALKYSSLARCITAANGICRFMVIFSKHIVSSEDTSSIRESASIDCMCLA